MTELQERPTTAQIDEEAGPPALDTDTAVGRNVYQAGERLHSRPGDGSLSRSERVQRPIPPNSLTWKYFGDRRTFLTILRTAGLENMWPQLGQAVSDHSQVFGDKANFAERGARSRRIIGTLVYATPEDAKKIAVKIRNYHKTLKGDMPQGHTYHAINPETYYWAHVTFFEAIYNWVDHFGRRPLTRAEKEQIFEESKEWFSLYGVDDSAQPQTYDEFVAYLADVFENELISTTVSRYTFGFASKPLPPPPGTHPVVEKYVWPRVAALVRLLNVGALEPILRDRLELVWTEDDERNFARVSRFMRAFSVVYDRLPLRFRFHPDTVAAFEREGIDPADITLESARTALAASRAAFAARSAEVVP
ncbi:oxygenase MpaB family protein [Nocardia rhizosphaerihabitans]|uniref:ER-bound oxygenase mpaB/mpaB'/Rubber oxygenase catalytic domain-containing protein n=1 Tax=Nocardia rhizosphaerihabitans TaxID=1691570 RepID=A0ABQ2KEZ7_9NOCA|nr:oxygenase MpaB family protein [Nocardia rhizosphaerihabitans]GGN80528.1 hypothetical protein GCM10011610_30000 [Nocardia rhizosphaerihabitans]